MRSTPPRLSLTLSLSHAAHGRPNKRSATIRSGSPVWSGAGTGRCTRGCSAGSPHTARQAAQGRAARLRTAAPRNEQMPATVQELRPEMGGRWEVRTRSSKHIRDLDQFTYTRLPGADSTPMRYDSEPMPMTRVGAWPFVGQRTLVFFDDPNDPRWSIAGSAPASSPSPACPPIRFQQCLAPPANGDRSGTPGQAVAPVRLRCGPGCPVRGRRGRQSTACAAGSRCD